MTDFEALSIFHLGSGSHANADRGLCAMEAVAWLEGLEHSDQPDCTCPVIAAYVRRFNDGLPDDQRQRLIPYLPKLVGTVSPQDELPRAEYLAWQAIRVFAPMALEAAGLNEFEMKLRDYRGDLAGAQNLAREARADAAAYAVADAAAARAATYAAVDAAAAAAAARAAVDAAAAAAAARAATYAAVDAAVDAARAATYADANAYVYAYADARQSVIEAGFKCLDGLLKIGKQAEPFTRDTQEAVRSYRDLIGA